MAALPDEVGRRGRRWECGGVGSVAGDDRAGRVGREGELTIEDGFTGTIGLLHLRLSRGWQTRDGR